jgi:hypothetical protein
MIKNIIHYPGGFYKISGRIPELFYYPAGYDKISGAALDNTHFESSHQMILVVGTCYIYVYM